MGALVALLRGEGIDPAEAEVVPALAEEQRVLALVSRRMLEGGVAGDSLRPELEARERDATIAAFFWSSELRSLLRAFANETIDVIVLKGPSLAERLYGSAALRTSHDLDLLVRKPDYAAAGSLLARLGFAPAGRGDDYHRQWRRQSSTVELHFDVENPLAIDFAIDSAWRDSIAASFADQPCRLLSPSDELLFLCVHGVRHRFERLSLVLDIAYAVEHFAAPLRLRAEVAELERLLVLGAAMARRLRPAVSLTALGLPPSERIEALAARLWHELTHANPKDLDWQAQHDFFVETELTRWRRLKRRATHLRIASTRLIDPDFAFAESLGFTRRWQVWMLRPLRLLISRRRASE